MDPELKGKCHETEHGCSIQEFCEDVNGIVFEEEQYVISAPQQIWQVKSNEFSKQSEQISNHEDIDSNESQSPHGEEFLSADQQCAVCDKIFDSQQILIIHALDNHPNDKAFRCTDCSEVFSKISDLERHRKTHDDSLTCKFCSKVFRTNYHLNRHLNSHTEKTSFPCPLCGKICKNQYLLQRHQSIHSKPSSKHSCKFCSKSFDSLKNLKIHLRVAHKSKSLRTKKPLRLQNCGSSKSQDPVQTSEKENKQVCSFCPKSFLNKYMLIRHLTVHSEERPHRCSTCNKAYKDKRYLNHHQKKHLKHKSESCGKNLKISKSHAKGHSKTTTHKESNKYKTIDVPKQFEDYILPHAPIQEETSNLASCSDTDSIDGLDRNNESKTKYIYEEETNHRAEKDNTTKRETNINNKQVRYKCAECDKIFKFAKDFIGHVKRFHHNDKAFKCSYCNAKFSNASGLASHFRIHKYKRNLLTCGFCSKSFTCVSDLKFHLEFHTVGRPYNCSFCEKGYKYKRDLTRHIKNNHLGLDEKVKSYVCEFCFKVFDRRSNFDRHVKVNSKTHGSYCLQSSFFNETPVEQETNITIKCKDSFQSDLSTKIFQNNKFSTENNEKENSIRTKVNEIIYSDNEPLNNDYNERNKLVKNKTEYAYNEVVPPSVVGSTESKIQQKLITDEGNRIHKSTKKLYGVKRRIQISNKCAVCNKMFIFQRDLIKHAQEYHQSRKPLKCRYCKERFSNIQTLLKHSRIHKEIIKSHRCEFCLEHFSTLGDLKSHLSNHFEDVFDKSFHKYQKSNITGEVPKRNHICELCSKSFSTMYRLNLHLKSHTVRKTLACSFCEKTFKSKSNLHYHEEIHKGIVKRYSCEICSKAFRSQSMVARHMIYHTNERSYSCYQCKKTYKHKVDLKKHQKICLQSNSCSLCEKIFADNESLQTHLKVHYVNKCAVCNKLCNSQRDLIKHARQFHPRSKAFQCQTCSLLLSNKLALNIHRKICFKVKQCAYCDRIIADDDKYKRHLTMHYVNKCAVCEKVCKSQRDLIDHAHQFHPNVKAFQCPVCDKLYASVTPFNCHTRTHKNVIKGDFLNFLYETKYKQHIDFELKFKKENGSNNMKQEPNNNEINENQHISKCYEPEVDSMNAEYLSDLEYTEQEVCQNDEDNAKETMNSIDIEILYNNTPDDELIVKNELDETNNEVIDIETIVPQVVDFEENFQQIESKQEIFLPLAVGMDLCNNEFIDIVHPIENLEDNSQQNEPELHRIIEESPTDSIDVEAIVQPVENLEHNYHNYYQNKPKQQIAIEVISSVAIGLDLSNSEFIIEDSTNLVENLKPNSKKKDFTDSAVIVHPIENLEDSSQQNKPILQQVIEESPHVAIGLELSKTEFIDVDAIMHPVENLEDNFENEPKKEQVIEKSPPLAIPAKLSFRYKRIGVKRKILTDKKCVICHKIFKFQRDLIKHAKRYHHNASAFKCKRCSAQFSNKQAVSIHYKIQHTTNLTKKYACKICSKLFTSKGDLNVHIKTHLPDPLAVKYPPVAVQKSNPSDDDSSRTFICDICSKGFAYKYRLTRHLKTHTTERPYICSMCGNTYKHEYTLKEHEKTHLDFSKSKHACEVCFQTFSCASRLNRHLVAHAKECPYSCSICGKTFKHFKNMKAHETKHLGIDPIKRTHICEFCSKGFAAESDLKHHLGVHTGERSYTCSKCEKDFKNENALNKHLQNHVNKPEVTKKRLRKPKGSHDANQQSNLEKGYMCEVCSKTFINMSRLHRHFKTHNVERPFSCSVCNKSYKHSKDLKIHEESHVISHICEMCNKTFAHRNSLLRHLKLHASCKCAICDMMCNSKQDLANHAKQYHPNDKVFKCQICSDLFDSKISLKKHMAKHKDNFSADHDYSHSLNDKNYKKKKSKLEENDIEESTAVATDDNQFVSNSNETNEENIVVDDDIDHTEELFANNEYYIEEITHTVNSQDTLEDIFIRIVTP